MTSPTSRRTGAGLACVVALSTVLAFGSPRAHAQEPPPLETSAVVVVTPDGAEPRQASAAEVAGWQRAGLPVVARGRSVELAMAQSVAKVGAPATWTTGERGAGKVVVVIDTGVDDDFGGVLAGQACFAADGSGAGGYCGTGASLAAAFDSTCFTLGVCGGADASDPAAGRPCPGTGSECSHGSAVAAVAARHEAPAGVAPDAAVYAIRVFDPTGRRADFADLAMALDHVRRLADAGLPVAAVNLSVATVETYAGYCDGGLSGAGAAFKSLFDQLATRGIATAVASGNEGRASSMGFPACVSSAVSVGATTVGDDLADFGNRGPGLDLLAPGTRTGSTPLSVPSGTAYDQWSGTSFSAPHVAGAMVLLHGLYPQATVGQRRDLLRASGVPVSTYRRLRLGTPAEVLAGGVLFPTTVGISGASAVASGDLDGDGRADIVSHGAGAAPDQISYGTATWRMTAHPEAVGGSYRPLVGNFRGTPGGPDDIFWYAPGPASDHLWIGSPSRSLRSSPSQVVGAYQPLVGDFDGDGRDDIFWYAPGAAVDRVWYGGSGGFTSFDEQVVGTYRPAVGDFDGDGRDDLVWHGPNSGADSLWRSGAARGTWTAVALSMGGSYTVRVGRFDADGADDLLLYQPGDRADAIWVGGGSVGGGGATGGFGVVALGVRGTYQPVVADVDGDALDDVLWYAPGSAGDHLWLGPGDGTPIDRGVTVNGTYAPIVGDLDAVAGEDVAWIGRAGATSPVWWSYEG